jgi:hypothetical protein
MDSSLLSQETAIGIFDPYGRPFPRDLKSAAHAKTRRRFVCEQPVVDYGAIHARLMSAYGHDPSTISAAEFERRAEKVLGDLRADPTLSNVAAGVKVPFFLANLTDDDQGRALDATHLPALKRAYVEKFPSRAFVDHNKEPLAGTVTIAQGSRHERVIGAARGTVAVGYYFPCLLEYSVPAALEQVEAMPEKFSLAGGADTCAAFVGSPDLLYREDAYPPLLWFAALTTDDPMVGFHLEAYGYNLTFNRRVHFGHAAEYWGSGVVVLG